MAIVPGSGAGGTGSAPGVSRAAEIASFAAQLNEIAPPSKGSTDIGTDYTRYMNAHPSLDPATVFNAVVADIEEIQSGGGLTNEFAGALGAFLKGGGLGISQEAKGAGLGVAGASKTLSTSNPLNFLVGIAQFFTDLTNPQMWLRIGKVVLGGVLLIVGAVQISHLDRAVATVASVIPK
jgi:hypothetical protein